MKIAFVSHSADTGTFKVGSHHYARELSRLGDEVLHVATPHDRIKPLLTSRVGAAEAELAARGPYVDAVGVRHVVPRVFWPTRVVHPLLDLRRTIEEVGFADADWVLVDQPLMHRAPTWFSDGARFIYRPTDVHLARAYLHGQRRLVAQVEAVVATSAAVLRSVERPADMASTVIENGVELDRFSRTARGERSGAVYVGAIDRRFDLTALAEIAAAFHRETGEPVDVYGPVKDRTWTPPHVTFHGPLPHADVPEVLGRARIGLLPFRVTPENEGRSPMKLYEYLAAGLPVVAHGRLTRPDATTAPRVFAYETGVGPAVRAASHAGHDVEAIDLSEHDWGAKARELRAFLTRQV